MEQELVWEERGHRDPETSSTGAGTALGGEGTLGDRSTGDIGGAGQDIGAFTWVGNSSPPQRKDFKRTFEFIAQAYLEFSSNGARAESEPGVGRTPQVLWV